MTSKTSDCKWSEISMEPDKEHLPLTSMADFKQNIAACTAIHIAISICCFARLSPRI